MNRMTWYSRLSLSGVAWAAVALMNIPVMLVILGSFQTTSNMSSTAGVIPTSLTLANYETVLARTPFFTYLANSLTIAIGTTVLSAVLALLAGYAMSRYRSPLLTVFSYSLFVVQMFPVVLVLIPVFPIFRELGTINTPIPVIILCTVFNLPFVTWMSRSYFDSIPTEIEEAARIDGCSQLGALWRIVIPLSGPGVAVISVFSFLAAFNEFFIASVFLRTANSLTVPVGIQMFVQQYTTDWGNLMAGCVLMMLPTLILFFFAQRYIVHGAVTGGVKG
ncbi:ABC transporter permease [Kaistia sp. 32K]|uniref:carbohydrate ABC transporter permease n=1 Tax=Kaistia sp. 32K TaxID=2795690 RepID=UPI001914ED25|nr:carbohydrate ABC transporter permease [Kaistia sp. 32K]BCP52367.1 ABC transporter permease [Kaistia sp. 32K]